MSGYLAYIAKRLVQFVLVVFIGINLAYVITHATPIDPVEQSISAVTSFGNTAPEAIEQMRTSLRELYGLEGTADRAISGVLEADPARRFRPVDVGVSDPGRDPDRTRAALDRRDCSWSRPSSPGCSETCWADSPATTRKAAD